MSRINPGVWSLLGSVFLMACGGSSSSSQAAPSTPGPQTNSDAGAESDAGGAAGMTFKSQSDAPKYSGNDFSDMQIYDRDRDLWLDDAALVDAVEGTVTFFGEQHETAPVQGQELWMLQKMTERHDDMTLGMEHFQHDEQPILDQYIAGSMSTKDFEIKSTPWANYTKYWKPLVEHMKSLGRPVVGLNVPDEALNAIYNEFPKGPLDVFNSWKSSSPYDKNVAPRPLAKWDDTYENYFKGSFDYNAHGKQLGLNEADALIYFTDLALIRDETMAYWASQTLDKGGTLMIVAGDWHVQTGLATPDRVVKYRGGDQKVSLITTATKANFDDLKSQTVSGRHLARFFLVRPQ